MAASNPVLENYLNHVDANAISSSSGFQQMYLLFLFSFFSLSSVHCLREFEYMLFDCVLRCFVALNSGVRFD